MDFATIIGFSFGVFVVIAAIGSGGDYDLFVNIPGLLIVLGGTFASTMIKFPFRALFVSMPVGLRLAVTNTTHSAVDFITDSMRFSKEARTSPRGLLVLEEYVPKVKHPFFAKGLQLCVDGGDESYIREILRQEMDQAILRQTLAYKIFFSIGEAAPAFGMFGTLVGLIQMLSSLDDPTKVGAGLAVALLTTLYGVLISYLFAMPIAEKLDQKALEDKENRALIMECIILIRQLKNPSLMYDFLESYLPEHVRGSVQDGISGGGDAEQLEGEGS